MFSTCMLAAISYIFGIYSADSMGISAAIFLFIIILITGIISSARKRQPGKMLVLLACIFIFGAVRYGTATQNPLVRQFSGRYVTARGTVVSQGIETQSAYKNRYTLKLSELSYLDTAYKANCLITLNTKERFDLGDTLIVSGFLREIEGISNEFEYDYSAYYKSRGIYARLAAREAEKVGEKFIFTPSFVSAVLGKKAGDVISSGFHGDQAAILKAVIAGDTTSFSDEYRTRLIKTGIYRSLHAPFIHIAMLITLAGALLSNKKSRNILIIIMLIAYGFLNSSAPTAIKACAVTGIVIFKKDVFGFANKADTLSLIVLIMTLADPMLCFDAGFVTSVASTILVHLSFDVISRSVTKFLNKYRIHSLKISGAITIWIIFSVGTLPFCAYFYNSISVYAALFPTLLSPLVMASGSLAATLRSFGGKSVAKGLLSIVEYFPAIVEKLPFSYLMLPTPTLLEIVVFYLLWWIFLRVLDKKRKTIKTKILVSVALALIVSAVSTHSFNTLSINFVNVGQGDGAVMHTTRGETILIDGGGSPEYQDSYNVGERVFLPYLISHGFTNIDVAILSHYHKDHAEGIIAAAESLKINTVVMPDIEPDNEYRLRLEKLSKERGFNIEYLGTGDRIVFDSGLEINFIAPTPRQLASKDLNDTSLVAEVCYGDFKALFTGDSEGEINENYPKDVDILKVAHHGSATSSSQDFVSHVNPDYAIISVGEDNSYGLPNKDVVERLKDSGSQVLRTDLMGDIRFKVRKNGKITFETLKGR